MTVKYDPNRAIDLSAPNPMGVFALIGHVGPFPSRSCDECGAEEFQAGDWSMGYRCVPNRHLFGTPEEWAWDRGQYRDRKKD